MKLLSAAIFLYSIAILSSWTVLGSSDFNVLDYGAIGNGKTDDSKVSNLIYPHCEFYSFLSKHFLLFFYYYQYSYTELIFLCIFLYDKAFLKAWNDVCGATEESPTLHVPDGKTYLLNPLKFQGPCKSKQVIFYVIILYLTLHFQ